MIAISIYDTSSGKILRRAMIAPQMVDANISEGEGWIEGFYDPAIFVVKNGQAQGVESAELEAAEVSQAWIALRMARDSRLAASDWTQAPDAPVDREAWATYRQALRDLPANTTDPRDVAWPEEP